MKVVIRGLPKIIKTESIQREIMKNGFYIIKVVQMISGKDSRVLPPLPLASTAKQKLQKNNEIKILIQNLDRN